MVSVSPAVAAHLVSLDSEPARRALALQRARAAGLDPRVHPACDGRTLDPLPVSPGGLAPGEIGCLLSHRALLREIAAGPADLALVLEDDVVFAEQFGPGMAEVLTALAEHDLSFVQVGWMPTDEQRRPVNRVRARLAASPPVRRVVHALRPNTPAKAPLVVPRPLGWGAHCYLVTRGFAGTLAEILDSPLLAPVDAVFRGVAVMAPDRLWRTRFPLAGQDFTLGSTVNPERFRFVGRQLDAHGRLVDDPRSTDPDHGRG